MDYYEYLKTPQWREIKRKKVLKKKYRGTYRCFVCGEKEGLQVRLINYRKDMMDTHMEDVRILCPRCGDIFYRQRKEFGELLRTYNVYTRAQIQMNLAKLELGIVKEPNLRKRKKTTEFLRKLGISKEQLTLA